MWTNIFPFMKRGISLQAGESKDLFFGFPKDKDLGELVLNYNDEYGNKYETRVLVDFKKRKIMSQSYKITKEVKYIPEKDRPRLVVHEKDLENYLNEESV